MSTLGVVKFKTLLNCKKIWNVEYLFVIWYNCLEYMMLGGNMDLLNIINNCSEEELKQIIDNALEQIDKNNGVEKTLGFAENMTAISKIPVHKGFISSNMRIKFLDLKTHV